MPVTIRLLDPPIHEFLPSEQQLQTEIADLRQMASAVRGVETLDNTLSLLGKGEDETARLAPLRESVDANLVEEAIEKKVSMLHKVRSLVETNPMLGHRGVRLGTNDLTQATFSFSREDAENKFLPLYNEREILQDNPFEVLDRKGVGKLMKLTVDWGREKRPDLSVGICGEHGGHPQSIHFCNMIGLNYASCSAPRVPIARLAAAHAELLRA